MSRPHFTHPLQNASGDLILGATVRVLDPDSLDPIPETVYGDEALSEALPESFQADNGQVEFYLEWPRMVTVEVTVLGSIYTFENRPVGFPHWETHTFTLAGEAAVSEGTLRYYVEDDCLVERVRISVGDPPTGSPLTVDINLNGSTIFTDQGLRPSLADGEYTSMTQPDVPLVPAGSYFTLDVDEVGSTFAGSQLVVQIRTGKA